MPSNNFIINEVRKIVDSCKLLGGLEMFVLMTYIDDIAIFSLTWENHMKDIAQVLKRLLETRLTVKSTKYKFAQDTVRSLGHEVSSGKMCPSDVNVKAIQELPTSSTKTQVRSFLGITRYYCYIRDYAVNAVPVTNVSKGKLTQSPALHAPDYSQEFIVQTDASL